MGQKQVRIYSSKGKLVNSCEQTSYMMWLVFQTDPYCCSADYRAVNHLKWRWLIASSQGHFCSDQIIYCFTFAFPKTIVLGFKENSFPSFEHISNVLFGLSHILPANPREISGSGGRASIVSSIHSVLKCRHHWSLRTWTHSRCILSIGGWGKCVWNEVCPGFPSLSLGSSGSWTSLSLEV